MKIFRSKIITLKLQIFNILLLIVILFTSNQFTSKAAKLKVVRTDVDSTRDSIITATYNFSVDLYIEELENCNSAAFQIRYNNAEYVKLSSYKIGDFGESGKVLLVTPSNSNSETILRLGVSSGNPIGENDFDNPKVLSLEFTVLQSAIHKEKLKIEFLDATATAFIDGEAKEVKLKADSVVYTIHGFVNLFPGDADNNGIVDINDWTKIDLFTSIDPVSDKSRRFKRKNASTMWTPQLVLAWDNELATYADCDGDGSITISDAIVVVQNDSKTRSVLGGGSHNSIVNGYYNSNYEGISSNKSIENISNHNNLINEVNNSIIKLPIKIQSNRKYKAVEVHSDLSKIKYKFANIDDYNTFISSIQNIKLEKMGSFAIYNSNQIIDNRDLNNGKFQLALASFDYSFQSQIQETIGILSLEINNQLDLQNKSLEFLNYLNINEILDNVYAVDMFGSKFALPIEALNENTTDIIENDLTNGLPIKLTQKDKIIEISIDKKINLKSINLYNSNGEIINIGQISNNLQDEIMNLKNSNSQSLSINIEELGVSRGLYFIQIGYEQNKQINNLTKKIIVN